MHRWIATECKESHRQDKGPNSNMIFNDILDGAEQKVVTSFVNPVNARYVTELAAYVTPKAPMWSLKAFRGLDEDSMRSLRNGPIPMEMGKILIITGYRKQ